MILKVDKKADALKVKANLQKTGLLAKLPLRDLVTEAVSSALSFSLVTGTFGDFASYLATHIGYFERLTYLTQRQLEMQRLMVGEGLCRQTPSGTRPPRFTGSGANLAARLTLPLAVGGAGTYGLIRLEKWFRERGNGKPPKDIVIDPQVLEKVRSDRKHYHLSTLMEMEDGRSLLDVVSLGQELEELLDRKVDILTDGGVNPYLKDRIYSEAVPL